MEIDIRLEKNTYNAGETAKGTLLIRADKSLKIRKLKFSVCGKERYEKNRDSSSSGMAVDWGGTAGDWAGTVGGGWGGIWVEKYDVFFFEDLSPFLKSIYSFSPYFYPGERRVKSRIFSLSFSFSA